MPIERKLVLPIIILASLIAVDYLFLFGPFKQDKKTPISEGGSTIAAQAYVLPVVQTSYIPILNSTIEPPIINGKSGIIFDTRSSRVLYEKNIKEKLPVASLTKIMTLVVAVENFDLDDAVSITKDQVRVDEEKQTLYVDEVIGVGELIKLMLVESSNDAAYALAHHGQLQGFDFLAAMNDKAKEIGMDNTYFTDPAGLDDNAYSTTEDILKLIDYSLRYKDSWEITTKETTEVSSIDGKIKHEIKNTDQLLGVIPGIIGGKTGYTDNALGCMILIVDVPNYPSHVVSIVLGSRDRFGDTQKLWGWVNLAYRWE